MLTMLLKRKFYLVLSVLAIVLIAAGCGGGAGSQQSIQSQENLPKTVKLAVSSWTGFAPLFVAQEKGFFKKEGANVELIKMESVADRRSALASNQIQGFATTVDTHVVTAAAGVPVLQVLALDDSYGGDGIVAKKEIKTLSGLKGKTVAVQTDGGASYFWFLYLLDKNNINPSEIKMQSMTAGDAGAAFVAGKVDAAVTWEPWLSKADKTSFGHVLMKSNETPGVIEDTLGLRSDFVKSHPQEVQAIVNGWFDALNYIKTNQKDAYAIMATAMGQTPEQFAATVPEVRWYDKEMNKKYFGTPENPGNLYKLTQKASDFWVKYKIIDKPINVQTVIDPQFIDN